MRAKKPDRNQQHFAKGSTFETRDKVTELARFDWPPMPKLTESPFYHIGYSSVEIARLIAIDDDNG